MGRVKTIVMGMLAGLFVSSVVYAWDIITFCKKGFPTIYGCLYLGADYKVLQSQASSYCDNGHVFNVNVNPTLVNWSDLVSIDPFKGHTPFWIVYNRKYYAVFDNGTALDGYTGYAYVICQEDLQPSSSMPTSFNEVTQATWNYYYSLLGDGLPALLIGGGALAGFFTGGVLLATLIALFTSITLILAAMLHLITLSPIALYGIKTAALLMAIALAVEWYLLKS